MKFNLPTKLTFLRIVLTIVIIILLVFPFYMLGFSFPRFYVSNILVDFRYLVAGIIFLFASFTDFLDGYLARKNNQVTDFGKFTDSIADKILVNSVLIIFAYDGFIPVIIPVIIVLRDIVVDAIRMNVAGKGRVVAAKGSGKIKAAALMIGMTLMFFYNLPFELWGFDVSSAIIYFGTIMSIISMIEYFSLNKELLFKEPKVEEI